ncbi:MAG: hypothetical protein QM662_17205 [Gordonia sp. (in: high G+C Gram-positive bacteria)]
MLTPYDELPHPSGDHPHWRESWYLNFFDHEQELYGIAWMGVRPPRGIGEILFTVMQGNATLHKFENMAIPIPRDIGRERTGFGPLSWRCLEAYKTWELDFVDDGIEVHFTWEAMTEVYNWEWLYTKSWHYQHPGRITGTIRVGDRSFSFTGMGERDRAWGRRDGNTLKVVHWLTAQFPGGNHIEAMQIGGDGANELYGYAHHDGKAALLDYEEIDIEYAYPGGPPVAAEIRMTDEAGREFLLQQEIMNLVAMGQAAQNVEARQYFTFNRYWLNGEPGYGMMDHWWGDAGRLDSHYIAEAPNRGVLLTPTP